MKYNAPKTPILVMRYFNGFRKGNSNIKHFLNNLYMYKINGISNISHNAGLVFAGTNSKKQLSNNMSHGGWGSIIKKHNLNIVDTVSLPTIWTFDQTIETPYIYTKFN